MRQRRESFPGPFLGTGGFLEPLRQRQAGQGVPADCQHRHRTIRRELGAKLAIAEPLESLGRLAAQGREWERAARLWGAAAALREALGAPAAPKWQEEGERELGAARAALGEDAFAAAWAEGRALTLEQAIADALAE